MQRAGRSEADRRRRVHGQNFLIDRETVRRFARFADPDPGEVVVEIGAGNGVITREMARLCQRVVAYEIDRSFADRLRQSTAADPRIEVITGDFLKSRQPEGAFSVVGNIPFGNTADIVDWCLNARRLRTTTLVTQLEYARKRTGGYGRWSRLTVSTWPEVEWRMGERISRQRFRPVPAVDSAVLRLERRPETLIPPRLMHDFRDLVDTGFTGKGGSLDASLRRRFPPRRVAAAFRTARLERGVVVAYVTPNQWITLFEELLGR
ncbi:ErmE/ErmH/ErmO/ErmR family 23S rRNA (adenine(2058)-N(6))-methyltransferase [Streptomyces sp. NPDC052042]|uniref:ErmE/ErmH/ErmO/ErmR family 23S rRNA (adenine(2058)-N(6))-methyltransferase n=1 Tax=Streptomyces sp. NPDC052042 TaxID=3365683 RepID=UPI0037D049CF